MHKPFSIALDGPSGAGKSSVARAVARTLGILYLDTGAMYRAVGLHALRRGEDPRDAEAAERAAMSARLDIRHENGAQRIYLDGEDVSEKIRAPEVSMAASAVSSAARVREVMVARQREIARGVSVVMDGRDIGTHVLPDATLKVFLTAPVELRAARRYDELRASGVAAVYEDVLAEMIKRDRDDSTRAASPLQKAEDAIELDTRDMDVEAVTRAVLALLSARLEGRA